MVSANTITHNGPKAVAWLIVASIRAMKPRRTWIQFIDISFRSIKSPPELNFLMAGIINDKCLETSTKAGTRDVRSDAVVKPANINQTCCND